MALLDNSKKIVRYPAKAGEVVGTAVGVPVGLILFVPSMIVCNFLPLDDESKNWSGFYPFVACRDTGTIALGGVPWLLFGWWGSNNVQGAENGMSQQTSPSDVATRAAPEK